MRSTRAAGCYFLNVNGDDGVRVYVDGVLVFNKWKQQANTSYCNNLIYLNGNSDIVLDYYEHQVGNVVGFSLTPFDGSSNIITSSADVQVCTGTSPGLIDGASFGNCAGGTNTIYQWQVSTDNINFTNISGANSEDYAPATITTTSNDVKYYRRVLKASASNASSCSFNSNVVKVTVSPSRPNGPGSITGSQSVCKTTSSTYSIAAVANASSYLWSTSQTGWTITPAADGLSVSIAFSASATSGNLIVSASNGCGTSYSNSTLNIQLGDLPTSATISGTTTVCVGASQPKITFTNPQSYGVSITYNINGGTNNVVYVNANSSINYTSVSTANAGTFVYNLVSVTNGVGFTNCSTALAASATVTVGAVTPTFTVSPGTNSCINTDVTYTTQSGMSNYSWTLPGTLGTDYSISSGGIGTNSNTVTLKWLSTGSKTVKVNFTSSCSGTVTAASNTTSIAGLVASPLIGATTHQDCTVSTGSVVLSGLPSTGTINQTGSAVQSYAITATSMTISGLVPGSYNFAVISSGCSSGTTTAVVINSAVTNTWNGTVWSNGTPTINQRLVFTGDYLKSNDVDLIGCSCTVENGVKVTIKKERYMKIKNGVVVTGTGTLTFEDQSSLVQINDAAINSGNITYKRETTAIDKFDYTYWSTPVKNQRLIDVSPTTSGDKFLSFDSSVNNWKYETNTNIMTPGKGYIIRGPEAHNAPNPPSTYEASFIGEPNNGVVSVTIAGTRVSNLMGNPYPSAVSADAFLTANNSVLSGTLYFWTHNTDIGTGVSNPGTGAYAYSSDDYASYNLTGGTGTSAVSGGSTPLANTSIPTGEIAAGQSFFGTSIVPGTATFNNSMRLDSGVVIDNTQFFKQVSSSKETSVVEKNRLWLDLMNDQGAFKQTLIGYITGATNDYESAYDGSSFNANAYVNFYSLQGTSAMAIQGRALPFDQSDIVPLGYKSTIAGDFKIAIDQVDGFFTSQVVYLEDKLLSVIHNLNDSPYAFTTEIGVFDDRFVISYANKTLATDDFETINNTVFIASKDKAITITASDDLIDKVYVYDFSGRQLYSRTKVASERLLIPNIIAGDQALIVKVILQNGKVITKKINY
nr:T9SS sorting signal type C domain-containing protein [Flavobacterium sp. 7E]